MGATGGFGASWLRSRGFTGMILVVAGAVTMAVGLAVPAAASTPGIYGFGSNTFGELGNGTTTASPSPEGAALGLPGTARQVAAGSGASAALLSDGTVWTWGSNASGQLGYSTTTSYVSLPRQVPGLSGITQIAMTWPGDGYAVGADGTVWAWGDNSDGQLGNGGTTSATLPARVPGLTGVTQVAAADGHVLARRSDGTVAAWGENESGELGDGTTQTRLAPVQVQLLTGITQIATAVASYAVRSDGTLFSWGSNYGGLLGNGTTGGGYSTMPARLTLSGVTQLATDDYSTLAVAGSAGSVYAWGTNVCGQLGDGTTVTRYAPEPIGLTGVSAVAVSPFTIENSSAAIRDGTLWTWGCNDFGQLGNGTPTTGIPNSGTATPTAVPSLTGVSQFVFGDEVPAGGLFDSAGWGLAISAPPSVVVPHVIGDTTAQAGAALQAVGLTLGTVSTRVDSTCVNIGKVLSQSPAAGALVQLGVPVSLTIGKRPAPPQQCP